MSSPFLALAVRIGILRVPFSSEHIITEGDVPANDNVVLKTAPIFCLHAVSTYKGHIIRDTYLRLVKFLGKIKDRLVLGDTFKAIIEIFTMKLPYNEAKFWDITLFKIEEKIWDRLV